MLPFLHVNQITLIVLELRLSISQLGIHFVVPLFDTFKHAVILIVLVLANLLLSLFYLFFFKGSERCKVVRQLFQPEVCLISVLLVAPVAIGNIVAKVNCLIHDLFESLAEDALCAVIACLILLFLPRLPLFLIGFLLRHSDFICLVLHSFFLFFSCLGREWEVVSFTLMDISILHGSLLSLQRRFLEAILHLLEILAELFVFAVDL